MASAILCNSTIIHRGVVASFISLPVIGLLAITTSGDQVDEGSGLGRVNGTIIILLLGGVISGSAAIYLFTRPPYATISVIDAVTDENFHEVNSHLFWGFNFEAHDRSGRMPMHLAINNVNMLKLLLDNGGKPNQSSSDGNTPLHYAVLERRRYVAELLLERGANPDIRNLDGDTPLTLASRPQRGEEARSRNARLELMKLVDRYSSKHRGTHTGT